MAGEKTLRVLTSYLDAIGVTGYSISTSEDPEGLLVVITVPNSRIGEVNEVPMRILKGRSNYGGQYSRPPNLSLLKSLLRIVGPVEGIRPILVIRLPGGDTTK